MGVAIRTVLCVLVVGLLVAAAEARLWGRRLREGEPCDTPGFFGDANDCRKFYRCAEHPTEDEHRPHLIRYTFRCPNGTVWDEPLSTCNHPEAVMDKPEPCQVYDPEEPDNGSNGDGNNGNRWMAPSGFAGYPFQHKLPISSSTGGLFLPTQNQLVIQSQSHQQQPQFVLPFQQIVYPNIAIPYGNFIQHQYG